MVVAESNVPDRPRYVGLSESGESLPPDPQAMQRIIAVKLAAKGYDISAIKDTNDEIIDVANDLFRTYREQSRLLESHLCPMDQRIQAFLDEALQSTGEQVALPSNTLCVDRYGLARELSLPSGQDEFHNSEISSYRIRNGVLHNPLNDKRTTKKTFHVAEYGLPVPGDKVAVPLVAYARILKAALQPPKDLNTLPYTNNWKNPVETMVTLHCRPLVCPEVPGVSAEKRLEVQFFVPGGCVANLDFTESVFGNGGDPCLPENDAGLDTAHWTGTTGCVIMAPHTRSLRKKDLGLPHVSEATPLQIENNMAWTNPEDLYQDGKPFKICCRDESGTMVTILADNYFGYCKKEIKTQIGLTANIFGMAEEEHAGGALAFKAVSLGEKFNPNPRYMQTTVPRQQVEGFEAYTYKQALKLLGNTITPHPEGYATDNKYPHIHVLPEDAQISIQTQSATYTHPDTGVPTTLRVLPNHVYLHPSGYKVRLSKHPKAPKWRLIGTLPEPVFCHKPSTVSGGGKSEISKSLNDAVIHGPIFIGDYNEDMDMVQSIIERDYSDAILPEYQATHSSSSRPILTPERTLGSVIKLLTPDDIYTAEHNMFVEAIPNHVRAIIFAIKSCYKAEMGDKWRKYFTVDYSNGVPGHELKFDHRQLVGSYLRVGFATDGTWRNYKMRQDFIAADKVQMEDDITASVVMPRDKIFGLPKEYSRNHSLKIVENCEWRLFQRPDDAIHPGYDKQTEKDMADDTGLLAANFQPLKSDEMKLLSEQIYFYDKFTPEMQNHIKTSAEGGGVNICSAKPRLVNGKPTKNVRYLQVRPDVVNPEDRYLAEMGARLYRKLPMQNKVVFPVAGVLGGRRNNPPDVLDGTPIKPLCVYNPLHYQELPELFMDYICCVTGKSPSTTGAGSEGALSKGPFNAIGATADLNNMLVSMILTGYGGFSSAAGYVGPKYKVDHDISLIVPELWCRMTPEERDPKYLIDNGFLEPCDDFEYEGRTIPAHRLGYRISKRFVHYFFCRIFDNPSGVFTDDMLRPEIQDLKVYVDGIENIVQAMEKSAKIYFQDGIIEDACPPLRAILHVMAHGHYNGKSIQDPAIRAMFTREAVLSSNWYKARLVKKQAREVALWKRNVDYLESFLARPGYEAEAGRLGIHEKLAEARREFDLVSDPAYLESLVGTLGADPIHDGYNLKEGPNGIPVDIH